MNSPLLASVAMWAIGSIKIYYVVYRLRLGISGLRASAYIGKRASSSSVNPAL